MKQKIRFLIKCLLLVLPLILISLYAKSYLFSYSDDEIPYYLWNKDITNTHQRKAYDVIILGDSVTNTAYIPEILSDNTLNLSLGGISPIESYYVLEDWLAHNPAPKSCYISFYDSHLHVADCFWKRIMFSHRFSMKQNGEILESAVKFGERSILSEQYIWDFISYELYLPNIYLMPIINGNFNQQCVKNFMSWEKVNLHNGRYLIRNAEYMAVKGITNQDFYVAPMIDYYYRKIIELCQKYNINVHLVKIPVSDDQKFTERYISEFEEYYDEIKTAYPKVTVDWISTYPQEYFTDGHHMNTHGAMLFSNQIKSLYSEDFIDQEMSPERIAAMNDSIKDEQDLEWILEWVKNRNYVVIICDKSGRFISFLNKDKNYMYKSVLMEHDGKLIDIISIGENINIQDYTVTDSKSGLAVQLDKKDFIEWELSYGNILDMLIIDNYNKEVVCKKKFCYIDNAYEFVK